MNIDTIVAKIEAEAREQSSKALENARARARLMERDAQAASEKAREAALEAASREAALLKERMLRMASLEDKKQNLSMKREVIEEAFARAFSKMEQMPRAEAQALSLALLLEDAQGDEQIVFGSGDETIYDAAFLAQANEALKAKGKRGALSYAPDRLPKRGGFVLRRAGMQMEMTWDMVLRVRRDALEADVAAVLFP